MHLDPIAASIEPPIRVMATTIKIRELLLKNPKVVAYLATIPSDKLEIALQHALEVGVAELTARRERFTR